MPLPIDFKNEIEQLFGANDAQNLFLSLKKEAPASVRLNDSKNGSANGHPVAWCKSGRYLSERPSFTFDPLFHAGAYYVQEASSMFIEQAFATINSSEPLRCLDLCAAPGGKSTLWRSLLAEGSFFVANEPLASRAAILAENLQKWGNPDTVVTCAYPKEFANLNGFFDIIAADVPCSGEGMFRKDEGAIKEWSLQNVNSCAKRQKTIIRDVWPALKTGGYLVYSTCTFNAAEDENNVDWICRELGGEIIPITTKKEWNITGDTTHRNLNVHHFLPHKTPGEGFFLALIRKTAETAHFRPKKPRPDKMASVCKKSSCRAWLNDPDEWNYFKNSNGTIAAFRKKLFPLFEQIRSTVRSIYAGVILAEEKGTKCIPQQSLALSTARDRNAFVSTELTYEEALTYLRRGTITLPEGTPKGYILITYKHRALGFVNNLGNRTNNMYPQEWRILSAHNPQNPVSLD